MVCQKLWMSLPKFDGNVFVKILSGVASIEYYSNDNHTFTLSLSLCTFPSAMFSLLLLLLPSLIRTNINPNSNRESTTMYTRPTPITLGTCYTSEPGSGIMTSGNQQTLGMDREAPPATNYTSEPGLGIMSSDNQQPLAGNQQTLGMNRDAPPATNYTSELGLGIMTSGNQHTLAGNQQTLAGNQQTLGMNRDAPSATNYTSGPDSGFITSSNQQTLGIDMEEPPVYSTEASSLTVSMC